MFIVSPVIVHEPSISLFAISMRQPYNSSKTKFSHCNTLLCDQNPTCLQTELSLHSSDTPIKTLRIKTALVGWAIKVFLSRGKGLKN